jgi:hypothetical protein
VVRGIFTLLVPAGQSNEGANLGREALYVPIGESVGWLCVLAAPALVGLAFGAPEHGQQRLKAAHQVGSPMQTKLT